MVKKILTISLLALFSFALSLANDNPRYLLGVGSSGQQEAMLIKKGETTIDAISRMQHGGGSLLKATGLVDTMRNYSGALTTNFGFNHQDVGFQFFVPEADGVVKEFWWYNYQARGNIGKGTIRGWNANPKLLTMTSKALSPNGNMGWYVDANDGDGKVTPFKAGATDTNWVNGVNGDPSCQFDPLGTEAKWLTGGLQVALDSAKWQMVKMLDWGDSLKFKTGVPFGFTLQNATKITDIPPGGTDARMELLSASAVGYPYHSIKFYETERNTGLKNPGWHIREYEWGMYCVVEYTSDRPPKFVSVQQLYTTMSTGTRTVTAKVTDDNPAYPNDPTKKGVAKVELYAKVNSGAFVKSLMTGTEPNFSGTLPGANPGDTVSYYMVATDVMGLFSTSKTFAYTIFKQTQSYVFLYNFRTNPTGLTANSAAKYWMYKDSLKEKPYYDIWNVKTFGSAEIPTLLAGYKGVVDATGDGGQADLTGYAGAFLATGTASNPKAYFFSDQDHSFTPEWPGSGADTTFATTDPHNKYFGVTSLVSQDYPYAGKNVTWPWQLDYVGGSTDKAFGFIADKMAKDTVTYWYYPAYEVPPFVNWMDALVPNASAKVLFKDKKTNTKVVGVRNTAADNSWATVWLTFDWVGTDFRSDTSTAKYSDPSKDPKYAWIVGVGNPASKFLFSTTGVGRNDAVVPGEFSLKQNYPNPFNPSTVIEFALPKQSNVTITIFNVLGQKVTTLVNEVQTAGTHQYTWNGKDSFGKPVSSGVYFYHMTAGSFESVKKMMLMK